MPPKIQYTKGDLLRAAFSLTSTQGIDALNARAIARELGCSTQPIFRAFHSMEEIRQEVTRMAMDVYASYINNSTYLTTKPYLSTGIAYILFAREERELFKLLFMCDRTHTGAMADPEDTTLDYVLELVMNSTGLSREQALDFHYHLWIFTHGLASMIATCYLELDRDQIIRLLGDQYRSTRMLFGLPPVTE